MATGFKLSDLPKEDRPVERLLSKGPQALSISELLSIIISRGTKDQNSLELARTMVRENSDLYGLAGAKSAAELASRNNISSTKAASIMAALELGRRMIVAKKAERSSITCPEDGVKLLMPRLRYEPNEHFVAILLNSKNKVLAFKHISEGSLNCSVVHPREVFLPAIVEHAAALFVAHNHPSGDPAPSKEDNLLTDALVQTGKAMGLPVLDHVIIGDGTYFSYREHALI